MGLAKVPRPADLRRRISDITEEGRSRKRQKLIEEHNARPRVATQTFLEQSAVSPKTAADYKMRMDVFNMFCFLHKLTTLNLQTLDTALTIFLQQCFNDGMELNEATKFLAAIMDARPEASARHLLPRARRSLKGWKNLDPGRSRPPIPWPLITLIVNSMLQRHQLISAMMILTMFVTYCRPFELLLLEKRDLISTKTLGMAWSLNLNKAEVMETSKMGVQDESMLLDSQEVPWLGKALMAFNKKMMQSPKMFSQDYYTLMKHWKEAVGSHRTSRGFCGPLSTSSRRCFVGSFQKISDSVGSEDERSLGFRQFNDKIRKTRTSQSNLRFSSTTSSKQESAGSSKPAKSGPKVFGPSTLTKRGKLQTCLGLFSGCSSDLVL